MFRVNSIVWDSVFSPVLLSVRAGSWNFLSRSGTVSNRFGEANRNCELNQGMLTNQGSLTSTEEAKVSSVMESISCAEDSQKSVAGGVTEEEGASSDAGDSSKDDADEIDSGRQRPPDRDSTESRTEQQGEDANSEDMPPNNIAGSESIPRQNLSAGSSSTQPRIRSRANAPSSESIGSKSKTSSVPGTYMQGYAAGASGSGSSSSSSEPPNVIMTTTARSLRPSTASSTSSSKKGSGLRRGKWTVEEEAYVARVIQDFNSGFLDAPAGTTLRTYLSEKLQCDPMRITKKFTGDSCIGKRVFHPAVRSPSNAVAIDTAQVSWLRTRLSASDFISSYACHIQSELNSLERRWRRRLELQQRESAKKAAASAAAAAAATGRTSFQQLPVVSSVPAANLVSTGNTVAQTATWLDRAKTLLQEPSPDSSLSPNSDGSPTEIMNQMHQVEELIQQGPPALARSDGASSPPSEPADKRPRTIGSDGDEGAEALVDFLRSVRESAANQEFSV